jgi:hypothetical protein
MTDSVRELQDKYTVISNQIEYQLQRFESKSTYSDKQLIVKELISLQAKLEDHV